MSTSAVDEDGGLFGHKVIIVWSGRRESNSLHSAWEADVLPVNYSRIGETNLERETRIELA